MSFLNFFNLFFSLLYLGLRICLGYCAKVHISPLNYFTGLHPSIIGGFSGMCAFMGVAATFVSSTLVKQFGILKVDLAFDFYF